MLYGGCCACAPDFKWGWGLLLIGDRDVERRGVSYLCVADVLGEMSNTFFSSTMTSFRCLKYFIDK